MPLSAKLAGALARYTNELSSAVTAFAPMQCGAVPLESCLTEKESATSYTRHAPASIHFNPEAKASEEQTILAPRSILQRRYSVNLGSLFSKVHKEPVKQRRKSIATLFPDKIKQTTLGAVSISHNQKISKEELALITQVSPDANIDFILKEYQSLPLHVKSTAGAYKLLSNILSSHRSCVDVDALYEMYLSLKHYGPSPDGAIYAILVDQLCQRDLELVRHHGISYDKDYFELALQVVCDGFYSRHLFNSSGPFNQLFRCMIPRGCIDKAIYVLSIMESCIGSVKDAESFSLLIQIFSSDTVPTFPGQSLEDRQRHCLYACIQIFQSFENIASILAQKEPRCMEFSEKKCVSVWLSMIDAYFLLGDVFGAVALFERMMAAHFQDCSIPPLDEQVVSHMVTGFVHVGDCRSAIQWLRHLDASHMPAPSSEAFENIVRAALEDEPTQVVTSLRDIAQILLSRNVLDENLYDAASLCVTNFAERLGMRIVQESLNASDLASCYKAMEELAERLFQLYDASHILVTPEQTKPVSAVLNLAAQKSLHGHAEHASALFRLCMLALRFGDPSSPAIVSLLCDACHLPMAIADAAASAPHRLSDACVRLIAFSTLVLPALEGLSGSLVATTQSAVVRQYEAASRDLNNNLAPLDLDETAWKRIVDAFCSAEQSSPSAFPGPDGYTGLGKLLSELSRLPHRPQLNVDNITAMLTEKYGPDGASVTHGWTNPSSKSSHASFPSRKKFSNSQSNTLVRKTPHPDTVRHLYVEGLLSPDLPVIKSLDHSLSHDIQNQCRSHGSQLDVSAVHNRLMASVAQGLYPTPSSLGSMINVMGRNGQVDRIDELYKLGLHALTFKHCDMQWRIWQWTHLEDCMMTALSHATLEDRANIHRLRIIALGKAPSASAYAALIATIQERTDDAVVAEELFNESQKLGVRPNTYLYNTIISKLSRARKAEQALRLFDEMQKSNLRPSSVTYGAAINACVRTGDESRATQLFAEMESQPMFQPRVPPYNTMIQYYVHSVRNRDKALLYYEKMQHAGVRPSAHTYKLLLDAWGTIEPIQPERQQALFARLSADRLVGVQGTHWASLIHTQGVVLRDLDQAKEIFDSIADRAPTVPRGKSFTSTVPDAVVYEALFAVFVAHGRTDLMPIYLSRMVSQGIWPTAYIANFLIKGYAQDGPMGLVEARRVFDAMIDPPAGIAASGNHLPRHHGAGALGMRRERIAIRSDSSSNELDRANVLGALVNREPSTYEAMIGAELAYGHIERAQKILTRMKARAFPAALLNRAQAMFDRV